MKNKKTLQAFTLVEMLISMTIFSIIMISVIMIYAVASDISAKYDITREMRQNIKSVVEDISEEVRKNDIKWVASSYMPWWANFSFTNNSWIWTRLKLVKKIWVNETEFIEYRLVQYKKWFWKKYSNSDKFDTKNEWLNNNYTEECSSVEDMCRIVKFDNNWKIWPLSNSKISFTNLSFNVSGSWAIPKVTLNFKARAAVREWIRAKLAEKTTLIFQTTLSSRALKVR